MNIPNYHGCDLPMRNDRTESHWQAWQQICSPGAQFTAEERISVVHEARHAQTCALCIARQAALSPHAVEGEHDTISTLPEPVEFIPIKSWVATGSGAPGSCAGHN